MKKKAVAPGKIVTVNGHKMHVFVEGSGKDTFVFMSGSGTACPTLDFKPLWSILAGGNRIAVVEKAGYGWSETTNLSRDIEIILNESREALSLAGLEAPYILVPHSMSGLEAILWAQTYPDEVKAIIGLDAAVPEAYEKFKIPSAALMSVVGFLTKAGFHRPFVRSIYNKQPAAQSGYISQADGEIYIEMLKTRTFTSDMINEGKSLRDNIEKVRNGAIPITTPLLLFISKHNEKIIVNWSKILSDYAARFYNGKSVLLDCGHYVHAYEPIRIADEINGFMSGIV